MVDQIATHHHRKSHFAVSVIGIRIGGNCGNLIQNLTIISLSEVIFISLLGGSGRLCRCGGRFAAAIDSITAIAQPSAARDAKG